MPSKIKHTGSIGRQPEFLADVGDAVVMLDPDFHLTAWNRAAEKIYGWEAEEVLGRLKVDVFQPEYIGIDRSEVIEALAHKGEFSGIVIHRRKNQQRICVETRITTLFGPAGRKVGYVSVNRDITPRLEAERTTHILLRVSEKLYSTLDPHRLLDELVTEVIELVDAESGCAGLRKPQGMVSQKYFRGKTAHPFYYCWPPGKGLPGRLLVRKKPYLTNDALNDRQITREIRLRFGIKSAISTPLLNANGKVIGFFDIHNKKSLDGFSESDANLTTAVARIAGIAFQNALYYYQLQKEKTIRGLLLNQVFRIQEEERRRLSRELHDEMGQSLASLLVRLRVFEEQGEGSETFGNEILKLRSITTDALKKIHGISRGLHPKILDDLGLEAALLHLAEEYRQTGGLELNVRVDGLNGIELPSGMKLGLYRIVQECLTNILKHARAKIAHVMLRFDGSTIKLIVEDDGCGFDPETILEGNDVTDQHLGLHGIRERVGLLDGTVAIESGEGKGTTLSITIPMREEPGR